MHEKIKNMLIRSFSQALLMAVLDLDQTKNKWSSNSEAIYKNQKIENPFVPLKGFWLNFLRFPKLEISRLPRDSLAIEKLKPVLDRRQNVRPERDYRIWIFFSILKSKNNEPPLPFSNVVDPKIFGIPKFDFQSFDSKRSVYHRNHSGKIKEPKVWIACLV